MADDPMRFAEEFPQVSYDDWLAEAEKALKGAPFDKRMLTATYEGITLRPIYTRRDWPADGDPSGFPGAKPFTRGAGASGIVAGWDIRADYADADGDYVNRAILTDLERGVTSLTLVLDEAGRLGADPDEAPDQAGRGGVMVSSVADLDVLLDGVSVELVPIGLKAGAQFAPAAALLQGLWCRRGVPAEAARGAFNADPLGALAATGGLPMGLEAALARLADLAAYTQATLPGVTAVEVDTAPYHNAGAEEATDLACALATGVAYLRAMTAAGMDIDAACRQIAFTLPVTADQFLTIAKLRAARRLWARVAEACGASEPARAMRLSARMADRIVTRRDPWVNMLRATVTGFAAAAGGAESITLQPFDAAHGRPDDLSRRVARNTHVVLQEESHLAQVVDPAGGSWYVESRTDGLAEAAWPIFQAIEAAGGMAAALADGSIAARIAETRAAREKNLARRKDPVTGVNEFPNLAERKIDHGGAERTALVAAAGEASRAARGRADLAPLGEAQPGGDGALSWAAAKVAVHGATLGEMATALGGEPTTVTPLPVMRLGEAFEAMRDASDAYAARTGAPPRIFLANLGPIAKHTARADFARNFFGTAGIEPVDRGGFDDAAAAAAAFKDSGASVAILCSADPLYEQMVAEVAPALKAAGAEYLFLAGNPGAQEEAYRAAGVDDFIMLGGDVLKTTRGLLQRLGVIDR